MARDRKFWLTASAVAGIFVLALFLRTYWYVDAAAPNGDFLLPESDSYYQHHTVVRIQTEGWHEPIKDAMVNYPVGGINPNPPLWDWWLASWGSALTPAFQGDAANHPVACPADAQPSQATCVSTWWVTLFSPALFGALSVLVIALLGHELWGWRAGLLAGFLAATSTSHIENTYFGNARHYSFFLFFIVLSLFFFVKALNRARSGKWVAAWHDAGSVRSGLASYARSNQLSLAFAALSGLSLAGVGLAWKGWPYVAGIMVLFGLVQVLVNHWRQRDSLHIYGVVSLALLVGTIVALPYYANPGLAAVFDTLLPIAFLTLGWLVIGLLFTASRDLPFVLVLPAVLVAGLIGLAAAFVVAPSVAQSLLGPLVYFRQTKLYTTIAEAHPADFDTLVFGAGLAGFFIALAALPWLIWTNRKTWQPSWTFMAVWAVVAIFMADSAVRFLANAVPVFALLGGWGVALIVERLRFETIGKNLAGLGGLSRESLKRAVNLWHVTGVVLLALLLVLPNVLLAVDAAIPPSQEEKLIQDELKAKGQSNTDANRKDTFAKQRLGAFGQDFISDYWKNLFEWLATQDTNLPQDQRPAFVSWWDYGHWSISLGRHPAVADNFQNGYSLAGHFLVAQNETQMLQLFLARYADKVAPGQISQADWTGALTAAGVSPADADAAWSTLSNYAQVSDAFAPQVSLGQAVKALGILEQKTGERIRYVAADVRLFPYDNPQTRGIDFTSIFYAPVTLSNNNPDDYVQAVVKASFGYRGTTELQKLYGQRFQNTFTNEEFTALQKDAQWAQAISQNQNTINPTYEYKQDFFNTTFYRVYIGTPLGFSSLPATSCDPAPEQFPVEGDSLPGLSMPAYCLQHFRAIYLNNQVKMMQYYPGATLDGAVTVDGAAMPGAQVIVYDDAGQQVYNASIGLLTDAYKNSFLLRHGRALAAQDFDIPHDHTVADAQGRFHVVLPFSTTGQVTVRAFKDGVELGNRSFAVTQQQAEQGAALDASLGAIAAKSGSVQGTVFFDRDHNRQFNASVDRPLGGANVTIDGDASRAVATGADGSFTIGHVAPGRHTILAQLPSYEMEQRPEDTGFAVDPGAAASVSVPMSLSKVPATGTVWRDNNSNGQLDPGEGVAGARVGGLADFRVDGNTALSEGGFSRENGTLAMSFTPGSYVLRGETSDGSVMGGLLNVSRGAAGVALDPAATRLVPGRPVSLNLTKADASGNVSSMAGATVLFVPASGGLPAGELTPSNGSLSLHLAPGVYDVYAQGQAGGVTYGGAQPLALTVAGQQVTQLTVGTAPVVVEARLAPR